MSSLPSGWSAARVVDIMDLVNGAAFKPTDWSAEGLPIIRIQNLNNPNAAFNHFAGELAPKFRVQNGDLLFAWSGTPGTSFGAHIWAGGDAWLNQHIFRVEFDKSKLESGYLRLAINQNLAEYIRQAHGGAGLAHITKGRFEESEILIPPLNEQHRIVAMLDALFERSRSIRDKLDRIPTLLDKLRKSIFAAALSGRLSRAFRGSDELISWTFERAADVCAKVQSGSTPKQGFLETGEIPFLKVYNIVRQKVDFRYRPQYVHPDLHKGSLGRSVVYPGDVLMNIVGPPLGKVAVVPDDFPEWNINQAITVFRPSDRITSGWLYLYLCGGGGIEKIVHETKGIVGQVNISLSQCRDFVIPVPPVKEQNEAVWIANELLRRVEQLEQLVSGKAARIGAFEQSSLAKAFRGELVPQDPDDEPALALLERIRAERDLQPATKRTRKTKTTTRTA